MSNVECSLPNPARCGRKGETDNGLAAGARELRAINQVAPHHCKPALDGGLPSLRLFDVQPLGLCGGQGFQERQGAESPKGFKKETMCRQHAANRALALACPKEPVICYANQYSGKLRLFVCRSSNPGLFKRMGSAFDQRPCRPEVQLAGPGPRV